MAVITICRDVACGGRKFAQLIATKLGYQFVDKSLLQKIAEELNVSESALESFEKSREYWISNLFAKLYSKEYIQRIVGYDRSVVEEKEYQRSLENLIKGIANDDNVVILGRAAHCFLQDVPGCYHVRLVAPLQWRRQYAIDHLGIAPEVVDDLIERKDRNRVWFHRSLCGEKCYEPILFHLVINMGRIPMKKAVDIVLAVVET